MKNYADMDPWEFGEWLDTNRNVHWAPYIAARDERILREAADRAESCCSYHGGLAMNESSRAAKLRDAILGKPRFVRGQLVRRRAERYLYVWPGDKSGVHEVPEVYEPIKAHIDAEGRVIVDD